MIERSLDHPDLLAIVVEADGLTCTESPYELRSRLERVFQLGAETEQARKHAVRDLLRHGGFKPSGRSKPASEYLLGAARKDRFPWINAAVDVCNLLSVETGLPISLLDRDKATAGGATLELRLGREGESYVFNPVGHEIDLARLLVVARVEGEPVGNPVKDSLATRTDEASRNVVAIVYGTRRLLDDEAALALGRRCADELERFAGAHATRVHLA